MIALKPIPRFVRSYDLPDHLETMYTIAYRMSMPRGADSRIAYIDYNRYMDTLEEKNAMPNNLHQAMLRLDRDGYLEYSEDSVGVVDNDQVVGFRAIDT